MHLVERSRSARVRAELVRGYAPHDLRDDLAAAGRDLRGALERGYDIADDIYEVFREIRAWRAQDLHTFDDTRMEIHRAFGRLRRAQSSAVMLSRCTSEIARACGFTRAMLSWVEDSWWVPVLPPPGFDEDADLVRAGMDTATRTPLRHMQLEADVVRRKAGMRIPRTDDDARCNGPVVRSADTHDYVVAPIMRGGQVIGFLHADRRGQDHPTTDEDLANLVLFAEQFGLLLERAELAQELRRRAVELRGIGQSLIADLDRLEGAQLQLETAASLVKEEVVHPPEAPAPDRLALLSPREREVLSLIVSGATNKSIARDLMLGEQTIKSHVAHVLRKLNVETRAEAAARYVRARQS